ncbi:lytic murein transglycosylase [Pseudooceanicola onchidii]|uniref:lytic murein transglycosylase n=1 Tax=Pseudooceanicola onchidii TaxID=2562279 RepID=UPI0010AA2A8C|nr:lytic murein transglycosylase [Pseudooceanicola onchidii]
MIPRRTFMALTGAATLTACGAAPSLPGRSSPDTPDDLRPVRNSGFDAWVTAFRPRAQAAGITPRTLDAAFRGAGFIPGVVTRDRSQPESSYSLEDYLQIAASDDRVAKGRAAFARQRGTLSALERRYGVPAEILCAVWGLESQYGEKRGTVPVISATATLAYDGRRGAFFEKQLIAALRILQSGDVTPANMVGSWAGAMGHTQFIPTSYLAYAVDFTGDGRRDIWSDDPTDALASTAAYLAKSGWTPGLKWGGETGAPGTPSGRVIAPQPGGPTFTVTSNFDAIKRYNNSDLYAIGIGHLSDRLAGAGPLRGSFPPDRYGMTLRDRIALQKRLTAAGYDTGGTSGVIGPKSRAAIRAYQQANGLAVTGDPSMDLLARV